VNKSPGLTRINAVNRFTQPVNMPADLIRFWKMLVVALFVSVSLAPAFAAGDPYSEQGRGFITALGSPDPVARARAAEGLGYLRYYPAEDALILAMRDEIPRVRRSAALALAWCGSRVSLPVLLAALEDPDWLVRQSAWVALTNLTGMEFPFDALAPAAERALMAEAWRKWIDALPTCGLPADLTAMLGTGSHHDVERAARAAGALGMDAAVVSLVAGAIQPWRNIDNERDEPAKWRVQGALRALGRSRHADALPVLIAFLDHPQWARYAAEALGDFGGENAAASLLRALPRYARPANGEIIRSTTHNPPNTHVSDRTGFDSRDRILAAPYAILMALSRIPFSEPGNLSLLQENAELIAAQTPLDIDGLVVYEEEPYQQILRHLLERAGTRRTIIELAFQSLGAAAIDDVKSISAGSVNTGLPIADDAFASSLLLALCRDKSDLLRLTSLLDHGNHWVRINAARILRFMDARETADAIAERLRASRPEADFGEFNAVYFSKAQGQDEFNDPTPRYREAFIMALGGMKASAHVPLLESILNDERNALGIRHRAAIALDEIGTEEAVDILRRAELEHPYQSVRAAAREALWRRGLEPLPRPDPPVATPPVVHGADIPARATRFVFIKGDHEMENPFQMDSWRQAYMTTDSGPTYRHGRNLCILDLTSGTPIVTPLTRFTDGYVADVSVSFDGRTVWFSRREQDKPWWHVHRIDCDGRNHRQVTNGNYHDIHPIEMPSGRIAFSSTRLGNRDEYHGYLCTGLATMHPDGTDIRIIGFNVGRDAEPAIADDGRILFTRLELFYSRMKTEFNLLAAAPDGTRRQTLYGPERRDFWTGIHGGYAQWTTAGPRHRQLRLTQPQAFGHYQYLLTTPAGPVVTEGAHGERILRKPFLRQGGNDPWVITTPWVLDSDTLLVAAGPKNQEMVKDPFPKDAVDLGLYTMNIASGEITLLYNDPATADFEARPLHPRLVPPVLAESPAVHGGGFTGSLLTQSAFLTREPHLAGRGKLVRIVEGLPQVTRHATHTTPGEEAWKNHGGTFGRDLATLPLAADGSFAAEVPADRFLHLQVLDSDRNVVGNQLVWMNVRPAERLSCIGCHEPTDSAPSAGAMGQAFSSLAALASGGFPEALPDGPSQMRYRAKMWFKGHAPQEREERQRTVQSTSYFGR
jgi:HEAT repeat protein